MIPSPREVGVRLGDARELLERQTRVLELIASAAPLPEILSAILVALERLIDGARCSVLLLDRERGTLHHGSAPSLPLEYVAAIDGMSVGEGAGSCGTAAALNAPVVAVDVRQDPRWVDFREVALRAGLRSCWSTPIQGRDGQPVGTFAVYHAEPHEPSEREQLLVDRFTHLTAVAIDHARLLGDLVESEERFRRSFDDNPLGLAILDLERTIISSNTTLTSLVRDREGLTGHALSDLLQPKGRSLHAWLDELERASESPIGFEAMLQRGALPALAVEVTVSLLRGRDGSPVQYVVNVLDLTERRAAEQDRRARLEAETARRTAEELSHAKSELLAALGHEVRTPLQAIVGFAELLGTIELDDSRRREALGHIEAAAGHVMELLVDVLDLSRIEARALPLNLEPVCVAEVVAEVFGLLSATAADRKIQLAHSLGDDVVHADARRLRQVMLNLVSNAIRHGNVGGHLVVAPLPGRDPSRVGITVQDDGPGIPAELLPRLFTPFARATRPADAGASGRPSDKGQEESFGLGLGLAHGLVVAMGGDLSIGNSDHTGTTMVLRLPRAPMQHPAS